MRRAAIVLVIAVITIAGLVNLVFAMGNKPPRKKYLVEKYPQYSQTMGRVARVDGARPTITISTEDYKTLVLIVNSETKLIKDGKNIKLLEIKKGDRVSVDYEIVYKDKNIAKTVGVKSTNMGEPKRKH